MKTQCKTKQLEFQGLGKRAVIGDFNGGCITSDGGGILLREVEKRRNIISDFTLCFTDYRNEKKVEHKLNELIAQRIYALALGYEDLIDHDELRHDVFLAALVEKSDPSGSNRIKQQDKGKALAGKSTLNRLELAPEENTKNNRYKRISHSANKIEQLFVKKFLSAYKKPPKKITLDLDATDDPLYGKQEGRFFHGYYRCYCYLPLYIFCGDHLLLAKLRESSIDASKGSVEELDWIVKMIREAWPEVKILIRADSGFCREEIMSWCEQNHIDFVLNLPKNVKLIRKIGKQLKKAGRKYYLTGEASRCYRDFKYKTLKSWNRSRRVIGKAEYLSKGANPRFVVTSLSKKEERARELYEKIYCARGEMENRIKEQQLDLFADRTSTSMMRSNQLRLWFSSIAYMLINELRRIGLTNTNMARAYCSTIRNRLFKIGALIRLSVRRLYIMFSEGYAYKTLFRKILDNLQAIQVPG